jgi:NAD(P)-dependent dehydrogenase (short-subunit alcohol dehydrogenase family)
MAKTWLITGTSRGFGWALAKAVLEDGDRVVATARRPEQLERLIRQYGDRVRTCALDVTDAAAARAAVKLAVDAFGSLDVVVNNAGYASFASIEDMPDDVFRSQIEANLFGVVNVTKAALHPILVHWRPRRRNPRTERLPDREVRGRRFLRGPQQRGEAPRHQGHHHRTRRVPHRLGPAHDANHSRQPGLRSVGRRDDPVP